MNEININEIKTNHPGGYQDIIETMERNRQQKVMERRGDSVYGSEVSDAIEKEIRETGYTSGHTASAVQRVLLRYTFPVPGDPKWLEPAVMWLA